MEIKVSRLFKWGEDYGDLKPGVGDRVELESGLTIEIKECHVDENGILVIENAEMLYFNLRADGSNWPFE